MSENRRYQVFVSSTFEDLKEERQAVYETLLKNDCIPTGMEFFGAVDEQQFDFIKKIIDDSDYYLVIIGNRYGSLTEEGISYTEKEYNYAKEKGLPISALIHGAPENISYEKSEKDQNLYKRLQEFKIELGNGRLKEKWFNPDDLAKNAQTSIQRHIKKFPRPGWIRGDKINLSPQKQVILEIDKKKNDTLETNFLVIDIEYIITIKKPSFQRSLGKCKINIGDLFFHIASSIEVPIYKYEFENLINSYLFQKEKASGSVNIRENDLELLITILLAERLIEITADKEDDRTIHIIKSTTYSKKVLQTILREKKNASPKVNMDDLVASFKNLS